jgi:hypothetical protein
MYMIRKIRVKAISFLAVICLIVPLFCIQVSAADVTTDISDVDAYTDIRDLIMSDVVGQGAGGNRVTVTGSYYLTSDRTVDLSIGVQTEIIWQANIGDGRIQLNCNTPNVTFTMNSGRIGTLVTSGYNGPTVNIGGSASIGQIFANSYDEGPLVYIRNSATISPDSLYDDSFLEGGPQRIFDLRVPVDTSSEDESETNPESPPLVTGDDFETSLESGKNSGGKITLTITDDTEFIEDGVIYYGVVDIKDYFTDSPKSIPKDVFISGKRYRVGEVVYIVARENLEIVGYTKTGLAYIFPAVENVENPVVFTAEGLPEGLALTEDGILYTEKLPLQTGSTELTVTADNGVDTHTIEVKITIKPESENNKELIEDLTQNDKEKQPEVIDEEGEKEPVGDVLNLWLNGELRLHYDPELDDFETLFLDGRRLIEGVDYTTEEGSTVIILTEQTMIPLTSGDHVVTTMFHQNTDLGMDTVINDVGSSSFVFRFGDEKTSGKRVNIGGDGVTGSVTFDDTNAKEEPITTIQANTEAIQERAANLSNATGREIIAAFETKQHGGFGGKTATFAVSVKSLDLTLKNGTAVYIAVYDSKTGKTYQNKGTVTDGMIVFRTIHSGVFMLSLEKF